MKAVVRSHRAFLGSTRAFCLLVLAFARAAAAPCRQTETAPSPASLQAAATVSDEQIPHQDKLHASNEATTMPRMIIDMTPGDVQLVTPPSRDSGKLSRWLLLRTASMSTRYNYIENSLGSVTSNQDQYQAVFKAGIRLDPRARYTIEMGLFSGRRFSSGWNGSGWGTGELRTNLSLKQLYWSATPITGLEFQVGGLHFNQGVNTEITGYDYDGYLTGERIRLQRPKNFFFDEISVSYAYVSEEDPPSVLKRFHRLQQSNYHQFLVAKRIGERILISVDYTVEAGSETLRQAIRAQFREARIIDVFHFENYQTARPGSGYGFAAYGEKKLLTTLSLGGGYTQHDRRGLYSDRFAPGKRIFANLQFELTPDFSISTSVTHAVRNPQKNNPRTRVDVALNYDLLRTLRKTKLF